MLERQLAILQPRFHHHTTIGPKRKAAVRINGPFQNKATHAKDSVITMEKQCKCCNNNGAGADHDAAAGAGKPSPEAGQNSCNRT